jgi:anti-sigma-K factor RskA
MADVLTPEERDVLAGEWVLGLLDGEARDEAARRGADTPGWAQAIADWEARLSGLYDEVREEAPPAHLWARIEAQVMPANDDSPDAARPWKLATALMTAVAASLAVVVAMRPPARPDVPPAIVVEQRGPALVAQLNDDEGNSMLAIRAEDAALTVRATAIPDGAGEPELWVIPAGGAPVSLGLIAREGETRVALADDRRALVADGATLALTLEPREGAPHAAPTGDILGTARITRL